MNISIIDLFTIVCSFAYACTMLSYIGNLLGFLYEKRTTLFYAIVGSAASLYTYWGIFQVPLPIIHIMSFFVILLLFHFILKGTWLQHIFASGSFIFHIICIQGITLALFSLLYQRSLYWAITNEKLHDFSIGLSFFIAICYLRFFSRKMYPMKDVKSVAQKPEYLKIMSASQGVLNIFLVLGTIVCYAEDIPQWFSWYHLSTYVLIISSFYLLFNFCVKSSKLQKYKSAYQLYEQQLNKQVEAYSTQVQYIQRIRKFKHDWIHMKEFLFHMIKTDNSDEVLKFMSEVDDTMYDLSGAYKEYSGHPLIQAILLHSHVLCQKQNIHFEASAILPTQLPLSDIDLCRIFTNITNNALEANERLAHESQRYIRISTSVSERWCTITCLNSFDGVLKTVNGQYHSIKDDSFSHGFGITNMEEILESCGGFLKIEPDIEKHIFQIRIHIPSGETQQTCNTLKSLETRINKEDSQDMI